MTINFDRITIAVMLATAMLPFAAFSPVHASAAPSCTVQAEQIRTLAKTAEPKAAAKALRTARLAEQLCAENGRTEAGKKFALAMSQLDTSVQLAEKR